MVTKKTLVTAVLATFCLTSALFIAVPTKSQDDATSANEYDPWVDTNDDGIIDIFDIAALALAFGAEGEPINKTALILDLQNRVSILEERQVRLKTIRFYTPNETMQDNSTYKNAALFNWIPQNDTSKVVLGAYCYFKYLSYNHTPVYWGLKLNGSDICWGAFYSTEYEQSPVFDFSWDTNAIKPNQNTYIFEFNIASNLPTYVKDINILIEMIELPPEDQTP